VVDSVLDLLKSQRIEYTASGKDYLIKCLNPEHIDTNPSLRIDRLSGVGHCFACGYKLNLFKHFGVITSSQPAKIGVLKEKIYRIFAESHGLSMPSHSIPYVHEYRGISAKTLGRFEAFTTNQEDLKDRLVFPLRDTTQRIVAFCGRHFDKFFKPKYKIYPSGVEVPLFPGKLIPVNGTIIIVEGIFDALNLIDKGLPNVVATMGVTTLVSKGRLNKDKVAQLKLQGITRIYIMYDGDNAGRTNAETLKSLLLEENFFADTIDLDDDEDPGDMSLERVNRLKRML
jgi:DNA primase